MEGHPNKRYALVNIMIPLRGYHNIDGVQIHSQSVFDFFETTTQELTNGLFRCVNTPNHNFKIIHINGCLPNWHFRSKIQRHFVISAFQKKNFFKNWEAIGEKMLDPSFNRTADSPLFIFTRGKAGSWLHFQSWHFDSQFGFQSVVNVSACQIDKKPCQFDKTLLIWYKTSLF